MTTDSSVMPQHIINDSLALMTNNIIRRSESSDITTIILFVLGKCAYICVDVDNIDECVLYSVYVCSGGRCFSGLRLPVFSLLRMCYWYRGKVGTFLYNRCIKDIFFRAFYCC